MNRLRLLLVSASVLVSAACSDATSDGPTGSNQGGLGAGGSASTGTAMDGGGAAGPSNSSSSTSSTSSTMGAGGCYATFDGDDDVLVADGGAEVGQADGFSVGAFIDPAPLGSGGTAFVAGRHADGSSNGYYLALTNDGGTYKARFIVFTGDATCSAEGDVAGPGGWQHILGSFQSPEVSVFVDGRLAGSADCPSDCNIDAASVVTVGRSEGGVFPYAGSLDDVAYYGQSFEGAFDPEELGCGSNARLRYSFDGVRVGRTAIVAEDCGQSVDAQVGTAAGADDADPIFACP